MRYGVLLCLILLNACALHPEYPCALSAQAAVEDVLYFGTARPDGAVSGAEWEAFLREVVTPRFPQGLTVWRAQGQWLEDSGRIVREDTYVLTLVHPDDPATRRSIVEIVEAYKARFRQEAVLRVTSPVCWSF